MAVVASRAVPLACRITAVLLLGPALEVHCRDFSATRSSRLEFPTTIAARRSTLDRSTASSARTGDAANAAEQWHEGQATKSHAHRSAPVRASHKAFTVTASDAPRSPTSTATARLTIPPTAPMARIAFSPSANPMLNRIVLRVRRASRMT